MGFFTVTIVSEASSINALRPGTPSYGLYGLTAGDRVHTATRKYYLAFKPYRHRHHQKSTSSHEYRQRTHRSDATRTARLETGNRKIYFSLGRIRLDCKVL
jgi:hypothetical protein